MDLLTHLMMGFIISSGLGGSFGAGAVPPSLIVSALPDMDILLYPIWKVFPFTRHHGLTHTPVFAAASALAVYGGWWSLTGEGGWPLFTVILLCALSHLLGDFLTDWGVPIAYPLKKKYFKLNIDVSISPVTVAFFFPATMFLGLVHLGGIEMPEGKASYLLMAIYSIYFCGRLALKVLNQKKPENAGFEALPTILPQRWKFARRVEDADSIRVFLKYGQMRSYVIPRGGPPEVPGGVNCDNLGHTYWLPEVQEVMRVFQYPYFETRCEEGHIEVDWHSAEMGDLMYLRLIFDGSGMTVRRCFRHRHG